MPQGNELRQRLFTDIENPEYTDAIVCRGSCVVGSDLQKPQRVIGHVDPCFNAFSDGVGTQDACCGADCGGRHGVDEGEGMLAGGVGDVDGSAGDAAGCAVEGGVGVGCLEHVPVGEDVEVGGQEGGEGVREDVERVGGWDVWGLDVSFVFGWLD